MLEAAILILAVLAIVALVELTSSKKKNNSELTRKIPHVVACVAAALLPFIISFKLISYGSLIYLTFVASMYKFNWFKHSRAVDRKTYGEVFFALGVLGASLFTDSKWIFASAMLTLGLADAAAALVGLKIGKTKFKVFGHAKSLEGSIAFWVVGVGVMAWLVFAAPAGLDYAWPVVFWLPFLTAGSEALLPYGSDNLAVPVIMTIVLSSLSVA